MQSLKTLIRLFNRQLDEKRRHLVALQQERGNLLQSLLQLQTELQAEQIAVMNTPDAYFAYANYAAYNQNRQKEVEHAITILEKEIVELTEEIMLLFSEIKKYETALERKIQLAKIEENRKESIRLDEIALNQYNKIQKEEAEE